MKLGKDLKKKLWFVDSTYRRPCPVLHLDDFCRARKLTADRHSSLRLLSIGVKQSVINHLSRKYEFLKLYDRILGNDPR